MKNIRKYFLAGLAMAALTTACSTKKQEQKETANEEKKDQVVNVYTHRHYASDQQLFDTFTKETGIKVNVVNASADELIHKLEMEGDKSPADVLITVDGGRLYRAKEKGLLKAISSEKLNEQIPAHYRDKDGYWFGLTYRARVIAYAKDRVKPEELSTYEDLTNSKWRKRLITRSSSQEYNQALLASIIEHSGEEKAKEWARGIVENFARDPKGGDRDQIKAVAAGVADIAIVNTYYLGKLLNSKSPEEVKAGQSVGVFFPNQEDRGTHVNISGIGVTAHAPHEENAVRFIEFLSGVEAQNMFAGVNFEYPVNPKADHVDLLDSWGSFKTDPIDFDALGKHNQEAVMIFDEVGWK
ncbi:Fe(3+) ABC transporter substrate-binding protein [Xanthovirga aplysinae]|uniref:Fe(3+) ABC transporter substrate-binding protein n=1 Tax=Xanthovirga aplysinae TaxID=2529853 RepID=UPI0012BD7163|nr:Fe(3+) ABC transporter substrate-binding protein [Xanthovirga aplysinae]MTI30678.1 Fe(3+) ABC transporter substrate-binding protein [Xanthovirga aplysinae]